MTKARSRGQRLRERRERRERESGLPDIAPVQKREKNGRKSRAGVKRSADVPALIVRCLRRGVEPTEAEMRESKALWWGCCAGSAMARAVTDERERAELWDAIMHMRKTVRAYDAACGAPSRHAKCLQILAPVDAVEASAESAPIDTRSDEDRSRSAMRAWMQMHGWLRCADKAAASEAWRVVIQDEPARDVPGLLSALRCVADGVAGRKIACRARTA